MTGPAPTTPPASSQSAAVVPLREAWRTWAFIGLNSFGGPAGQIAVMHKTLVEDKRWISEPRFLHALNYCMLLPGPEAMQLATYVGWLMHRTRGGLLAGLLFIAPGALAILALSIAYTAWHDVGFVQALLFGLKAAVLAIVVDAIVRIGRRVLKNAAMLAIALAAFIAIFLFHAAFPLIVVGAAAIGLVGGRIAPRAFAVMSPIVGGTTASTDAYLTDHLDAEHTRPTLARALRVLVIWLPLWLGPVLALRWCLGPGDVFADLALFFGKAAVVTFGGAYAVLAYVAQHAVDHHHWLEPEEMLTGLGMAESTPGPLIMVVQFVGYMGAYRDAAATGGMNPTLAGALGSVVVTWVTFVPCFMWIFLGAPFVESVRGRPTLNAALSAITAAVVGVILNLAIWFALHTLFREVREIESRGVRLLAPAWRSVDWAALVIALAAALALIRLRCGVPRTLALAVAMSLAWFAVRSVVA